MNEEIFEIPIDEKPYCCATTREEIDFLLQQGMDAIEKGYVMSADEVDAELEKILGIELRHPL